MRIGRVAAVTDTGRRRLRNQDAYVSESPLFAVADGMGGAQAGELASQIAAAAIEERTGTDGRGEEAVAELVRRANERVYRRATEDPAAAGMGTTATVALVDVNAGTIAIGHVGDSRAYRLRDGVLEQLTADHSLVAELVRSGRLTEEEAVDHPHRSVITRALGTDPDVDVDALTVEIAPGDLYLICSDGLTHMLPDADVLATATAGDGDPDRMAALLVEAANRAGGEDNITVIVFEIVDGDEPVDAGDALTEVDEVTAESQPLQQPAQQAEPAEPAERPSGRLRVRRHGPGSGGRLLALAAIATALVVAGLVVYWGVWQ
ncbi:MAG TPA: Stp1/IreP family PP2C-type Ser/Thr phosphatase [Gaiellaceae bacterium]|nr:Stp1/IreP family PP2C-type Ser/Thr phosphatase [Gaiellaceae bacterium]